VRYAARRPYGPAAGCVKLPRDPSTLGFHQALSVYESTFTGARPAVAEPITARAAGAVASADRIDRALLNAIGVAVYTTDANGRINYYNEAAAELWGRRPELGEMWCGSFRLMWVDGAPMAHDQCPMAVALRESRPIRGVEAMAERPDGSRVVFQPFPTPLYDETGTLTGAINVMVDVTERTRVENALRASNAVKDEFLGLVSHEMRTPVTTILGNARLLLDRGTRLDDSDRRAMVADIGSDAERLASIIENLLMLTRLESGVHVEFEPQVLAHVVRTVVTDYATRHRRQINLTSEPRHLIVEADRAFLEMLLENLISNADKYSPADEPIEVVVRGVDGAAEVIVRDRGIGLPSEAGADVFAPFYRAPEARERAAGVGVGLAVCRRLVEAQRGRIWAAARDGGGAEFGFSLPLAPVPGEAGA
jgi:PAS domain S-box-containing protein